MDPKTIEYDPHKNADAICIIKQPDGNWMGWMQKFGKVIEVREVGPDLAVLALITHNGD